MGFDFGSMLVVSKHLFKIMHNMSDYGFRNVLINKLKIGPNNIVDLVQGVCIQMSNIL